MYNAKCRLKKNPFFSGLSFNLFFVVKNIERNVVKDEQGRI